ncbi:MAG: hypothetical protein IT356_08405 [Gemmatimonadaceae bacterium]|nr:hypothetical protein [Gemmatimonadaceae bacterium]
MRGVLDAFHGAAEQVAEQAHLGAARRLRRANEVAHGAVGEAKAQCATGLLDHRHEAPLGEYPGDFPCALLSGEGGDAREAFGAAWREVFAVECAEERHLATRHEELAERAQDISVVAGEVRLAVFREHVCDFGPASSVLEGAVAAHELARLEGAKMAARGLDVEAQIPGDRAHGGAGPVPEHVEQRLPARVAERTRRADAARSPAGNIQGHRLEK